MSFTAADAFKNSIQVTEAVERERQARQQAREENEFQDCLATIKLASSTVDERDNPTFQCEWNTKLYQTTCDRLKALGFKCVTTSKNRIEYDTYEGNINCTDWKTVVSWDHLKPQD